MAKRSGSGLSNLLAGLIAVLLVLVTILAILASTNASGKARAEGRLESVLQAQKLLEQQLDDFGELKSDMRELEERNVELRENLTAYEEHYAQLAWYGEVWYGQTPPTGFPFLYDQEWVVAGSAWCTGSMEPTLGCSDITYDIAPAPNNLDIGDIVAYQEPNPDCSFSPVPTGFIQHRIIDITVDEQGVWYGLQGDNNPYPDPCWVPYEAIVSKTIGIMFDSSAPQTFE